MVIESFDSQPDKAANARLHNLDDVGSVVANAEQLIKEAALQNKPIRPPHFQPRFIDYLSFWKSTLADPFKELIRRFRS